MSDEEYLNKGLYMINLNSVYGIQLPGIDQADIAKIIQDYMDSLNVVNGYYRLNCPKPPIYIGPVKIKTLKERLEEATMHANWLDAISYNTHLHKTYQKKKEENKMKATSVQNIKNVKDIVFSAVAYPIERESKLTIVAYTDDDIFEFNFEGQDLIQQCKKGGLFISWEKDQKIRELETDVSRWKKEASDCLKLRDEAQKEVCKLKKENEKYEEKIKKLEHDDMLDKNAADYWSKEHDILLERFAKLQVENEKLKDKVEHVEPFRALERTIREKHQLQEENEKLEKQLNAVQLMLDNFKKDHEDILKTQREKHKDEVEQLNQLLTLYEKRTDNLLKEKEKFREENEDLKKAYDIMNVALDKVQRDCNKCYEKYIKTLYEQDSHKNTRADILDKAKKCVCGQREQDYGTPESNFQLIADLWNDYLKKEQSSIVVDAKDVAMMMSLLKIARIRNGGGSGDSFVDLAGYAACGG